MEKRVFFLGGIYFPKKYICREGSWVDIYILYVGGEDFVWAKYISF